MKLRRISILLLSPSVCVSFSATARSYLFRQQHHRPSPFQTTWQYYATYSLSETNDKDLLLDMKIQDSFDVFGDFTYYFEDEGDEAYVFEPELQIACCGLVLSKQDDWEEITRETSLVLQSIIDRNKNHTCIGFGDESDSYWSPFAIQWSDDQHGELTATNLLKRLGAHPNLMESVFYKKIDALADVNDCSYDEEDGLYYDSNGCCHDEETLIFQQSLRAFLEKNEPWAFFYTGDGMINPVPYFAVAKVAPDLVTGYTGGVIYT